MAVQWGSGSRAQLLQILIEPTGEGEEIVPLILQGAANRPQPIDALRRRACNSATTKS